MHKGRGIKFRSKDFANFDVDPISRDKIKVIRRLLGGKQSLHEIQIREAVVIDDPVNEKTWVDKRLTQFFMFWFCMAIVAAFINTLALYIYRILPDIYAAAELKKVFWGSSSYAMFNIFIAELVILVTCCYALSVLVHPDPSDWMLGNTRWFTFAMFIGYLILCLMGYIPDLIAVLTKLESTMRTDLENNRFKDTTQKYFHCCGVTASIDWTTANNTTAGYPLSCCDIEESKVCIKPLYPKSTTKPKEAPSQSKSIRHQNYILPEQTVYMHGCWSFEKQTVSIVGGLIIIFILIFVVCSSICVLWMSTVLSHVKAGKIKIQETNPFFD